MTSFHDDQISGLRTMRLRRRMLTMCMALMCLLAAEAAVRVIEVPDNNVVYSPGFREFSVEPLGYLPVTGTHRAMKRRLSGETIFDVAYSIGEDGFRVTPGARGVSKAYFLGCSFMFGWGLNDDQTLLAFFSAQ